MQMEGTKLIFIMNFSVLDFFKFTSRMPQIAQVKLVSTFKIFRHAPDPPRNFLFFLHYQFQVLKGELSSKGKLITIFALTIEQV